MTLLISSFYEGVSTASKSHHDGLLEARAADLKTADILLRRSLTFYSKDEKTEQILIKTRKEFY